MGTSHQRSTTLSRRSCGHGAGAGTPAVVTATLSCLHPRRHQAPVGRCSCQRTVVTWLTPFPLVLRQLHGIFVRAIVAVVFLLLGVPANTQRCVFSSSRRRMARPRISCSGTDNGLSGTGGETHCLEVMMAATQDSLSYVKESPRPMGRFFYHVI